MVAMTTVQSFEEYLQDQVTRLSKLYNVTLTSKEIDRIRYYNDKYLTDSKALCDLIELVCRNK